MAPDLEETWRIILADHFPGVVVRRNRTLPIDGDEVFYNVYMLPNDKHAAFSEFCIEDLWHIAEKRGLAAPFLLPVDVTDTLKLYPDAIAAEPRRAEAFVASS